jgi:hypothetical protein
LWKELCEKKALLVKYVLSEQKCAHKYTLPILSSSLEHRSFHYAGRKDLTGGEAEIIKME